MKSWLLAEHRSEYRSIQITQLKFQGRTETHRQEDNLLSLTFQFKTINLRAYQHIYFAMGKSEIYNYLLRCIKEGKACWTTSPLGEDPKDSRARQ